MSFFFNEIGLRSLEVAFHSYRIGFWSFICIFAFIPNPSYPQNYYFDHGLWYFNHQYLVYAIVLLWIWLSSHEYPILEHIYCLLVLMLHLSQVHGSLLSYFSRQIEPHFGLFLQAILLNTPHSYGVSLGPGLTPQNILDC